MTLYPVVQSGWVPETFFFAMLDKFTDYGHPSSSGRYYSIYALCKTLQPTLCEVV